MKLKVICSLDINGYKREYSVNGSTPGPQMHRTAECYKPLEAACGVQKASGYGVIDEGNEDDFIGYGQTKHFVFEPIPEHATAEEVMAHIVNRISQVKAWSGSIAEWTTSSEMEF